jgi:signal transduction histidine kinase
MVWREEVPFLRKDGSAYDTLLSLTPVRFMDQRCLYATVEDVTEQRLVEAERRRLEAQLAQAQKMEAVGRMTAGIAHDFNDILQVVTANADLAVRALAPDDAAVRGILTELAETARRGASMIRKLMGYSRATELQVTSTHVGRVLQRILGMVEPILPEGVVVELRAADVPPALCDPGAMEQIVLNLVTNARDAMPNGGKLRFELILDTAEDRPPWLPDLPFVRLSVIDSGVGMDEATKARAYEPFFTTKAPGFGTGLGLSMVFGLIKQQGGYMDLVSTPGQGTTAHMYLPLAEAE